MNWKVISFYTPDYKDEVDILIKSLDSFKIPYDIECVKSKGEWKENACYKIPFIIKKLRQYNHPLVWLDADAKVVQYPIEFDNMGDHLMGGIYTPFKKQIRNYHIRVLHEYVSNTIYFVPSKEVFSFLEEVNKFIKEAPNAYDHKGVGEQFYMTQILESNNWVERLKFREMPYSYGIPSYWGIKGGPNSKIFDCYKEAPVIVQRQASRRKDPVKKKHYQSLGLSIVD